MSKREIKGKNFVVLIPFVVVVTIVFAIGVGVKSYEASKKIASNTTNTTPQQKWELCWEDNEEKRCGVVEKIVFCGPKKQIIKIRVYHPLTGVTVDFFRDPAVDVGIWVQPGDKREWALSPTKKGGYSGRIKDHHGWHATLLVRRIN